MTAVVAALVCNAVGTPVIAAPDEPSADASQYDEQVRPFLARHCLDCHSGEKPKGGLHLDQLTSNFADESGRKQWRAVLERVTAREMPPKAEPRPNEYDLQSFSDWISSRIRESDADQRQSA